MEQPQDFKSMQEAIQTSLIATTRSAGQISSEDLAFQRSLNPEVGSALDEQSARLLELSNKLLQSAASISEVRAPKLDDADDVENQWRVIIDVVDSLLEKADASLDEYTGVIKRNASPSVEQVTLSAKSTKKGPYSLASSFRTQNIVKPQLFFQVQPDNDNNTPWTPRLTRKPHATVALEESMNLFKDELGNEQHKHPYETEISQLQYPDEMYQKAEPISYLPFETTTATFVDTYEGVLDMLKDLRNAKEIAIDLEHHDARSYIGLVSLMQISTREKDWIVDTLKPWREDLQILNEVFADPKIIKVLHGAYMDIVWLQRDLGLYITGLFDTHHACRVLGYPGASLAFLLKKFVDFDADKKYQMADWRIRPLPEEMFFYARSDTHFLLYIFDNLRNELIERSDNSKPEGDKLESVLQKSKETSLLRYERQLYDAKRGKGPGGWFNTVTKLPLNLGKEQFAVYRAVHQWRDQIARKDDDSPNVVMPNHALASISKVIPTDIQALYSCLPPISRNVRTRVGALLEVIQTAKAAGAEDETSTVMDISEPNSVGAISRANGMSSSRASPTPVRSLEPLESGPLRTGKSAFWGQAFGSSIWQPPATKHNNADLRLAVPMPKLLNDAFSDIVGLPHRQQKQDPVVESPAAAEPLILEEEAFVVKTGRKRKSDAISSTPPNRTKQDEGEEPGEYDISLNEEMDQETSEKAARKAEKKAAKRAKKALDKAAEASGQVSDQTKVNPDMVNDEEAFDYSKAESVLHAKREPSGDKKGKKQKNKPFDPYKKSEDAPKGMRRVQSERAGKSHTFRN